MLWHRPQPLPNHNPRHPSHQGVDVHAADALGRLCVSDAGLLRRELLVLDTCLGEGVPLAGYVGGGYSDDLEVLAARHCALHEAGLRMYRDHGL